MWLELTSEFRKLSHEGGWVFWCLIVLAFSIAVSLITIALSLTALDPYQQEQTRRRINFCFVLIGAAPLIGLLGTVHGMLVTFAALATSSGGASAPVDAISAGISEALITTQTGLVIAVPTMIICTLLKLRHRTITSRFPVSA